MLLLFCFSLLLLFCQGVDDLYCQISILGSGIGSLYSAYHLNKQTNYKVCLFEKNDYYGGRIHDVQSSFDPNQNWIPLGAIRIDDMHEEMKELNNELNITLHWKNYEGDIVNTRGIFGGSSNDVIDVYPTLNNSISDLEDKMYEIFMDYNNIIWDESIPKVINLSNYLNNIISKYNNMEDYLRNIFEPEGLRFLQDNFRFRDDFTNNDIKSYLQFLLHEFFYTSSNYIGYPEGALSESVRRIVHILQENNHKLYLNEPIKSILYNNDKSHKQRKLYKYKIISNNYNVYSNYIIINIPPLDFQKINGNIAQLIQQQKPFQDARPVPVFTVEQIYENRWWENAWRSHEEYPIQRIWTTDNCINFVEIPKDDYQMRGTVGRIRSIYSDGYCAQYWKTLFDHLNNNITLIEYEIQRSLQYLFSDVTVPLPLDTKYHYWDAAWHFQYPKAKLDMYELEQWAKQPIINENIMLIGEAWHISRGWQQGAVKSAQTSLKYYFNLQFTDFWSNNDRRRIPFHNNQRKTVHKRGFTPR